MEAKQSLLAKGGCEFIKEEQSLLLRDCPAGRLKNSLMNYDQADRIYLSTKHNQHYTLRQARKDIF